MICGKFKLPVFIALLFWGACLCAGTRADSFQSADSGGSPRITVREYPGGAAFILVKSATGLKDISADWFEYSPPERPDVFLLSTGGEIPDSLKSGFITAQDASNNVNYVNYSLRAEKPAAAPIKMLPPKSLRPPEIIPGAAPPPKPSFLPDVLSDIPKPAPGDGAAYEDIRETAPEKESDTVPPAPEPGATEIEIIRLEESETMKPADDLPAEPVFPAAADFRDAPPATGATGVVIIMEPGFILGEPEGE